MASSSARSRPPYSREATDPITKESIRVHDNTSQELDQVLPDFSHAEQTNSSATSTLYSSMESVVRQEAGSSWWKDHDSNRLRMQVALVVCLAAAFGSFGTFSVLWTLNWLHVSHLAWIVVLSSSLAALPVFAVLGFLYLVNQPRKKEPEPEPSENGVSGVQPESAMWLNSLLHGVWGIINPALFTSVADMLEDGLQASMPAVIKAVRVADIGQGSESIRILGVHGIHAAQNDEHFVGDDFVNLEVALAYRAKNKGSGLRDRSQNPHLLMQFWTSGSIVLPVWVELTGMIATVRLRLQLTPNPPFLSALTFTLLGQPKITLKCTPLAKNFLNVMDVPGLSGWLQRTIDDAISAYVIPRSMSLDLKTILTGREKMDTDAIGVILVTIKRASGFKNGDGIQVWKSKDSRKGDPYVTLGWAKLGKPLWSSRIITNERTPVWEETTSILVNPSDVNADEKLRVQLWDSDRLTADDLVGAIEVSLKDIMQSSETSNKMSSRCDKLTLVDHSKSKGNLEWDVGFFSKITLRQVVKDPNHLPESAGTFSDAQLDGELDTEEAQDRADEAIARMTPSDEWLSGILSVRIIQITGLGIENVRASGVKGGAEDEDDDDLPSPYCSIILNEQLIFKTRKKMKSNHPYYDAGTERFIRDWQRTNVMIAVRDSRLHEKDALIGVLALPLQDLFSGRSQVKDSLPLIGGVGFGRVQFAMSFRSVRASLGKPLLGWDLATLEIHYEARLKSDSKELDSCTIYLRTPYGKGKLRPSEPGLWKQKQSRAIHIPVRNRFSSCLLVQFKKHVIGPDVTPALATLWLKEIPDNEEKNISLPIIRNKNEAFDRARLNATDVDLADQIGTLHLKLRICPGLSGYHKSSADKNMVDVMEVLDSIEDANGVSKLEDDKSDDCTSDSDAESGGFFDELKEFKGKQATLHKKHRGLMQWSGARKMMWAKEGVKAKTDGLANTVKGKFKHRQANLGVEGEV